jgi:hypothetical protein
MSTNINVTDVVGKYIRLRDLKAKLDNEHKDKMAPLAAAMEKAEAAILAFFNESGMDSAGCEAGTAYRSTKTSATVADRDAFFSWVQANDAFHFLESRAAKTQVEAFVKETGDLPPGIKYSSISSVNVRRS